jgi:hypothetical protein
VGSPDTAEFTPPKPGIQLEEILYRPKQGAAPFIELANAGAEPVSLQQLTLMIDATPIALERAAKTLAPGKRLLVILDGPARVDGLTYHAGENIQIAADAGHAAILDKFGKPIDEVAWGHTAGAINPVGGGGSVEIETGASIGRAPGTTMLRMPQSWVAYSPSEVTPGAANPPAVVRGLHPMAGTMMSRKGASLSWLPVSGATGYHVQVAVDDSFAKLILDLSVKKPRVDVSGLSAGRYLWRVQSQFAGNAAAAYSQASVVTLMDIADTSAASHRQAEPLVAKLLQWAGNVLAVVRESDAQVPAPSDSRSDTGCDRTIGYQPLSRSTCVLLRVPLIKQHKDTSMLLLEHPVPIGVHTWDADHGDLDEEDPSDNANCGLASLAMMNHYVGGDLNQDRIGYEVLKDRPPVAATGPEHDLMYGQGLWPHTEMRTAYEFALGTTARIEFQRPNMPQLDYARSMWADLKSSLERGKPVLIYSPDPSHFFVVVGYELQNGRKFLIVNDPWDGQVRLDLGDADVVRFYVSWVYYVPAGDFTGRMQEATVTQDSDGDGVVDFDESQRFHTDPRSNDTDGDGVGDKQDIYASVFDNSYGYARFGTGRDEDNDGRPMELDPDSDAGGCKDGDEDRNGNGIYEKAGLSSRESWNFWFVDDSCQDLTGHLTYDVHSSVEIVPGMQWGEEVSRTGINVRLKPVPDEPGFYEDDGSTFHYTGSKRSLTEVPDCRMIGVSWASASGDFTGDDAGLVQGHIQEDGRLGVHFTAGIPPENVGGYGDICGHSGSGSGDSHSADFRDECLGDPLRPGQPGYVAGRKIFRFNCHDTHWDASGTVSVP